MTTKFDRALTSGRIITIQSVLSRQLILVLFLYNKFLAIFSNITQDLCDQYWISFKRHSKINSARSVPLVLIHAMCFGLFTVTSIPSIQKRTRNISKLRSKMEGDRRFKSLEDSRQII